MNSREITKNQFDRTVEMLNKMAGESMHIRFSSGAFWAFGSELATLKLAKQYKDCDGTSQGYSVNLETHYFMLESLSFHGEMETA